MERLRAAILVVSDTASLDASSDRSSSILKEVFKTEGQGIWVDEVDTKIVADETTEIQKAITRWTDCDSPVNLIISTGGTGFATKDLTPEAIAPLLHKHAPGLVHGMLAASLAITPFALMARPLAGVRHSTIIITLPGSPKGAKENLESLIKLLPHACQQALGADTRELHSGGVEKLEAEAGVSSALPVSRNHSHHHHHHNHGGGHHVPVAHTKQGHDHQSNDPMKGPSHRHRASPYPMLSVPEALSKIESNLPSPEMTRRAVDPSLVGYVLAEDVKAEESVPAFRASIVDGYAINAPQSKPDGPSPGTKGKFTMAFASHARPGGIPHLPDGQIARITTGAPLPPNSNAVVMVEDTKIITSTDDGTEEKEVEILTDEVRAGENVREIGSDVHAGERILKRGEGITAIGGELGLLASVGVKEVLVYRKPILGVLSTGDEIVSHELPTALELGQVRDTNRPTLLTAARAAGFEVLDLGIAADKATALESTLRQALSRVDVLLTSGGVSMGELDLLKPMIERALGGTIHFGRVSMKPGKPTTFATVPGANIKNPDSGHRAQNAKVIFSLPGNPASAIVTFMLFALPALHQMSGIEPRGLPQIEVRLDGQVQCDATREEYHRVVVFARSDEQTGLWASSTGGQRSSRIGSFRGANALLKLPAGGGLLTHGQKARALLMSSVAVLGL